MDLILKKKQKNLSNLKNNKIKLSEEIKEILTKQNQNKKLNNFNLKQYKEKRVKLNLMINEKIERVQELNSLIKNKRSQRER